jgi:hypothetical protein
VDTLYYITRDILALTLTCSPSIIAFWYGKGIFRFFSLATCLVAFFFLALTQFCAPIEDCSRALRIAALVWGVGAAFGALAIKPRHQDRNGRGGVPPGAAN